MGIKQYKQREESFIFSTPRDIVLVVKAFRGDVEILYLSLTEPEFPWIHGAAATQHESLAVITK